MHLNTQGGWHLTKPSQGLLFWQDSAFILTYAQHYLQGILKLSFLLSWTQTRGHGEGQASLVLSQGHTEQLAKLVRGSDPRTLDPVVAPFHPPD